MNDSSSKIDEKVNFFKIIVIIILILICFFLELSFILILHLNRLFSHFFYLPSILTCFWWKKKGLIVPLFLASLLIFLPIFIELDIFINSAINSTIRSLLLIIVSITVAFLSYSISKKEEELIHINKVLYAIRNVNQLITKEKDRDKLLQGCCDSLIETRGYFNAWIALLNDSQKVICTAEAGLNNKFLPMVEILKKGEFSNCYLMTMTRSDVVITSNPSLTCIDCPLANLYEGRAGMTCRLEYMDKNFGWIAVSIPKDRVEVEDEQKLFKEVADDIALALSNIYSEEKRKESEINYLKAYNRAELYKDLFAHDINNILQGILSGTQLTEIYIGKPEKLKKLKEINKIIKDQVGRGGKLVSNIRKLSQLEEFETNLQQIEICNILKKSIYYLKNAYHDKTINIQTESISEKLYAQANNLLEDVFENILINAIIHNDKESVNIDIRISKELKMGIDYLRVEFKDNGKGVEDKRKKKIFIRERREEKSIHGMGLGLSLVGKIIESYEGKIWVEDRVKGDHSKGSRFIILIPEVG